GSSKGIGEGVARGLAREGATASALALLRPWMMTIAHDIAAQGGSAQVVIGDLTNDDGGQGLVDEVRRFAGPVEIASNNAGGSGETEDWSTTRPET
ncbi:SDR family NAD(P)-dependent oxidoreductase, partial [Rhizobium ruizarguesonis]